MKKNKVFLMLVLTCLLTACFFAVPFSASAATVLRAEIVKHASQTEYRFFDNPVGIAGEGDRIHIADNSSIATFSVLDNTLQSIRSTDGKIKKLAVSGKIFITIEEGGIHFYNGADSGTLTGDFSDLAVFGNKLYAVKGTELVYFDILENEISAAETAAVSGVNFTCLTGGKTRVFFAAKESYGAEFTSIYSLEPASGAVSLLCDGIKQVFDLEALPDSDNILALSEGGAVRYDYINGSLLEQAKLIGGSFKDISITSKFAALLKSDKSVSSVSFDLKTETVLMASSGDDINFYSMPSGLSARKGAVYVADKLNNRVKIVTDNSASKINHPFNRPTAVAADHLGNIFVTHAVNRLACFTLNGSLIFDEIIAVDGVNAISIEVDSAANLYLLDKNGDLYFRKKGDSAFIKKDSGVLKISTMPDSTYIMALKADGVYRVNSAAVTLEGEITSPTNLADVCFDKDKNIFALLKDGSLLKFAISSGIYSPAAVPAFENGYEIGYTEGSIIISPVSLPEMKIKNGDLLVTSSTRHTLLKIDGKAAGVSLIEGTVPPDISGDDVPDNVSQNRIIRKITAACEVYAVPSELNAIANLPEDFLVIVPEIDTSSAFSFIIADNVSAENKNTPITGYVYTDFLSEPLPYTSNHPEECRVWNYPIPIYKWPSRQAPILKDFAEIQKDTRLKLMDFVYTGSGDSKAYGFIDNFPKSTITWYRVQFGENNQYEGYVAKDGMSVNNASPDPTIRPQFNAKIISLDKNNAAAGAQTFELVDGEYVPIDAPALAVGTKVEVIGKFDTSVKYTLIKYGSEFGTVTCYVLTDNIKYNGVNVVAVVAIIIICVALILIVVLVLRALYIKRNKRLN